MRQFFRLIQKNRVSDRRGFTLVELLIVISIIGVLVALLMPAVNAARESGRRIQCAHNLHQLAEGCVAHMSKFQYLPSGGWGWQWAGDPDRGYGASQPGGWHYSILPFIDNSDLHDMSKGMPSSTATQVRQSIARTPVAVFLCPTRHGRLQAFPYIHSPAYVNIPDPFSSPSLIGKSDYAGNTGSNYATVEVGDCNNGTTVDGVTYPAYSTNFPWFKIDGTLGSTPAWSKSVTINNNNAGLPKASTGVICRASEVTTALIKDGESNTYLIGERYLDVNCYFGQTPNFSCCDNDQGWDQGFDWDSVRGTADGYINATYPGSPPLPGSSGSPDQPFQDRRGFSTNGGCSTNFGSAHEAGFNMAFCDGQVRLMSFAIDLAVHTQLGHRSDGQPTNLDAVLGAH
jgi:prepilin-type N-terminal cleavage/methylation domain-containing protein/prepilin-type processing-associated H-X9-DG protein